MMKFLQSIIIWRRHRYDEPFYGPQCSMRCIERVQLTQC